MAYKEEQAERVAAILATIPIADQLMLVHFMVLLDPAVVSLPAIAAWIERHRTLVSMLGRIGENT